MTTTEDPTPAPPAPSRTRERLLSPIVIIVVFLGVVGAVFVATRSSTSQADRIADMPERILESEYVSLTMRTSLTQPDGTIKYTDSSGALDVKLDKGYVDLPDVLRSDTLELVNQGSTLYITIPKDLREAFPGIRWLKIDTPSRAHARGAGVGAVPDPSTVMVALAGATGKSTSLGEEEFNGEQVKAVRVAVEPRLVAERLGGDHVESANVLGRLSLEWEAEVWIAESDGLPRRVVLSTQIQGSDGPIRTLFLDLTIEGIGVPIEIGIPPADAVRQVESVDEALQLLDAV